jgi:hypothetical protein
LAGGGGSGGSSSGGSSSGGSSSGGSSSGGSREKEEKELEDELGAEVEEMEEAKAVVWVLVDGTNPNPTDQQRQITRWLCQSVSAGAPTHVVGLVCRGLAALAFAAGRAALYRGGGRVVVVSDVPNSPIWGPHRTGIDHITFMLSQSQTVGVAAAAVGGGEGGASSAVGPAVVPASVPAVAHVATLAELREYLDLKV